MNKKYIAFGLIGVFAMVLVSAVAYYTMFSTTFTVVSAIGLEGCGEMIIPGNTSTGSEVEGNECIITNNAPTERTITITDNSDDDINVRYMSELTLIGKDTTTWIGSGDNETIKYTVVGDEFIVEDIPTEMTLIYYPNFEGDDFATNVAGIQVVSNGASGDLPVALDVGDDYCNNSFNPDATQCFGAKLWLIDGVLDETEAKAKVTTWSTSGFLFETALIQYNQNGTIVLSSGSSLTITPVYTIGNYAAGEYTINTTIA